MKKNKNFQHRDIATKGSDKLESFFDLMQENGWTGRDGWDGNSEDCYYYINTNGGVDFDVEGTLHKRVDNDEFIDWYSDMLATIEGEREDVIKVTREEFKKIYNVACTE